jgi:hypothetical protein
MSWSWRPLPSGGVLDDRDARVLAGVVIGQDRYQHALAVVGDLADAVDLPRVGVGQPTVLDHEPRPGVGGRGHAPLLVGLNLAHQRLDVLLVRGRQRRWAGEDHAQQPRLVVHGGAGQTPVPSGASRGLGEPADPVGVIDGPGPADVVVQVAGRVVVTILDHGGGQVPVLGSGRLPGFLRLIQQCDQDVDLDDAGGHELPGAAVGRLAPGGQVVHRDGKVAAVVPDFGASAVARLG